MAEITLDLRALPKAEAYDDFRRARTFDIEWAGCDNTIRGHIPSDGSDEDRQWFGTVAGQCINCRKLVPASPTREENP